MKRTHPLPTAAAGAALGLALLAAAGQALAQRAAGPADAEGGNPAELLRQAQSALRGGQAAQANALLERAETRLLAGVEPTKPTRGDPAFHASEARRALANRDRADAMRHTNMAIATARGGESGTAGTGSSADAGAAGRRGVQSGGGGPGTVDSGMGTLPAGVGRAVVWDGGTGGASVSRAEGIVLAQSGAAGTGAGAGAGNRAPTGLPPGDSIPGWSGARGGLGGGNTAQPQGFAPAPAPLGAPPAGTLPPSFSQNLLPSGPSSSGLTGGEPARVGGSPPGDTTRSPGSSGVGGAGVGGPLR